MSTEWNNDGFAQFPVEVKAMFAKAKEAYKVHKALQAEAEAAAAGFMGIAEDEALAWNYRFGDPSFKLVAAGDKKAKTVKATKPKIDLSTWIAQRRASGLSA